jgi:hypothetical protein
MGKLWVATRSDTCFDALQAAPDTVESGPGRAVLDRYRAKDINRDRIPDRVLCFLTPEVGRQCGDTKWELAGETSAGDGIIGTDSVKTVGCRKKPKKVNKKQIPVQRDGNEPRPKPGLSLRHQE